MFNKILAISPHTDDIELGCGATLNKFAKEGKELYYIALSDCQDAVPAGYPADTLRDECINALLTLGLKEDNIQILQIENKNFPAKRKEIFETLENLKEQIKPDLIIIPSLNETHQDHKTTAEEAIRAFRNTTSIICYEQPWNNLNFKPKFFIKLDKENVETKIEALKKYKSQLILERPYFDDDLFIAILRFRGSQIKEKYAEAFEIIKLLL